MSYADEAQTSVRERYKTALKEIQSAVTNYWLNYAFLMGQQWTFYNRASNRVDVYQEGDDRIRPRMNRMRSNFRTIVGVATQRALSFEVMPQGADDHSVQAARLSERLLKDLHLEHNWESLREDFCIATFKGGTAAISVDWDEDQETTVEEVLPINSFVVQPGVKDAETAVWWIKAQLLPPSEVKAMFELSALPPADGKSGESPIQEQLIGSDGGGRQVEQTLVLTYYERPNKVNPKGKFCVEVDGRIVQEGPWPFPFKHRLNLVIATETAREDKWWGDTFLNDCRPVQVAYNLAWANLLEHMADAGASKLLIPQSAMKIMEIMTDIPGEYIPYPDGTEKPGYLQPPQLASWLIEQPGMLALILDDLMGVHDVSRGTAPANIESGYGLSILAEKDSTPVGRFIKETAHAFSRLASMVLAVHEQEVRKKRTSIIRSEGGPIRFEWTGKDIAGQTKAVVPEDAIMPRSRAALQAFADKALQMKMVQTVDQYARLAELPGQEDIVKAVLPAVAKAQRENSKMANGEVILPAVFDAHGDHIRIHNDFRMTEVYELLPPSLQQMIDQHVQAHETLAAEQMGRAVHQAQLDPNLALTPNADGSGPPPVMPTPPDPEAEAEAAAEAEEMAAVEVLDPEAATAEALTEIHQLAGEE